MTKENEVVLPVLQVLAETTEGWLPTGEVRRRVIQAIRLEAQDLQPLRNRSDRKIDQTIRNLKSHRASCGNPFHEELLADVPRGFAITDRGRRLASRMGEA